VECLQVDAERFKVDAGSLKIGVERRYLKNMFAIAKNCLKIFSTTRFTKTSTMDTK
jgi:hypothetical protein